MSLEEGLRFRQNLTATQYLFVLTLNRSMGARRNHKCRIRAPRMHRQERLASFALLSSQGVKPTHSRQARIHSALSQGDGSYDVTQRTIIDPIDYVLLRRSAVPCRGTPRSLDGLALRLLQAVHLTQHHPLGVQQLPAALR
jgi:hypothetical protein